MMLSVVTETLFLAFKAFSQVSLPCFTDPGLLITGSTFMNLLLKHCRVGFWQILGTSHRFIISYSIPFYAEAYVKTQSKYGFRQRQKKGGGF